MTGGGYIYAASFIIIIISILISYNFLSYYFVSKKAKYVLNQNQSILDNTLNFLKKNAISSNYINSIEIKLFSLGYPYGFNTTKYLLLKYGVSLLAIIIIVFQIQNFVVGSIFFCILFFIPDILINSYKKNENLKIINDISNIVQNIILSLSANISLYNSLLISEECIETKRFKYEYEKFVSRYMMYNFNMQNSIEDFEKKFDSYEFNMFLTILIQGEKEGNMLETLESFYDSLQFTYFKYLKFKTSIRLIYVTMATIITLVNCFLIVMYPMLVQISGDFVDIFK